MPGIYIHIPFCRQACHYCNFHFSTTLKLKEELIACLRKEIAMQKDTLAGRELDSVYFGGGTPSILTREELLGIFEEIETHFVVRRHAEVTLEANPDDLTPEKIQELRSTPVNRLSIGVQSFSEEDLHYLHRVHDAAQAATAVHRAQDAGFEQLSVDLIYGIPGQGDERWLSNLQHVFSLDIPHISAYALTVEPRTPLDHLIRTQRVAPPEEERGARHFELLMTETEKNGYLHYEISNFCQPGHEAVHNSSYWKGKEYLGIGPSAHSYFKPSAGIYIRQWNAANNVQYIRSIGKGIIAAEKETLTPEQRFNEYLLISLRTMWGCSLQRVKDDFGEEYSEGLMKSATPYLEENLVIRQGEILLLTSKGKLLADRILSDLFAG